ncbi:CDP-alcohol phosphatidyltransferase family protein [Jannaschia sp. W003]|uniref:CDP-alcohol phosphatidyltransferase family protein n=1 Tax=Jannaschia sp. W003 TaxID=2867012 RepID=UPI0021A7E207|nr:CDP-alcohol phosphatidyltransferase family protein [Jannaschia sp. W003]UWQ23029.1 CDP-alcohol phosphatidyltransferase family protein [Jannaschia sp. W003]
MLDSYLRPVIDPPLNRAGRGLAARGVTADGITLGGLALGLLAAALIWADAPLWAVVPLLLSRLLDGLDGAVARATERTDFGGFLDIWCDFAFYGAIPLAFALRMPPDAVAAAFLLFSFYLSGTAFLGFAIVAEKRGISTDRQGIKSLYYSAGLLEGTETILFLVLVCLVPDWFAPLAWTFGALCIVSAAARVLNARHMLR